MPPSTPAPSSAASTLTVGLCCLIGVFEGYDLQVAGVAAPKLGHAFQMTPEALSWFFSASTFGVILGALIGGRLSDLWGRKTVLIGAVSLFGLMSILNALAPNLELLLTYRFLTGVGLGAALPNLLALVAENASPRHKNTMLGLLYAGLPFGGALASLLSLLGGAADWQLAFYVGGAAPLLAAPLLLGALPESGALQAARAKEPVEGGFAKALVGGGRGMTTACLWTAFFLALLTMYVLLNWLPSLLVERGLDRSQASIIQVGFNLLAALGSIATGLLMDRLKLTIVVALSFTAAAGSLLLLAGAPAQFHVMLIAACVVGASMAMTQSLLYATAPASYPVQLRGSGVGASVSVGRLGSAVGPLLVGALLTDGASSQQALSVLAPAIGLAGAAALILALRLKPRP